MTRLSRYPKLVALLPTFAMITVAEFISRRIKPSPSGKTVATPAHQEPVVYQATQPVATVFQPTSSPTALQPGLGSFSLAASQPNGGGFV